MGIRFKFNFVLIAVFIVGFATAGAISFQLLQDNARDEVLRNASLMMESAYSVRTYTVEQIQPKLIGQLDQVFMPQTVPAYAATETFIELKKKYPDFSYKEATLNPTNLRDRASDWEADMVNQFRQRDDVKEIVAERDTPTGRQLYIAKPIRITNPACLQCHTSAESSPPSMVKIYGTANGFGWQLNDIVGAQVVTVPMDVPMKKAKKTFETFIASLFAVFMVIFIILNLMISYLIINPIRHISRSADKISNGEFGEPELSESGKDEMAVLSSSFNRMRRSLEKAIQMIEE